MRSIDEPVRVEVARARPGLMHLLANHGPGGKRPEALLELVEAYLRLNPDDAEVRKMCQWSSKNVGSYHRKM
jgi:hypothetical protein